MGKQCQYFGQENESWLNFVIHFFLSKISRHVQVLSPQEPIPFFFLYQLPSKQPTEFFWKEDKIPLLHDPRFSIRTA